MHKVAVLLDGGYLIWELQEILKREVRSHEIISIANNCYDRQSEDLLRIYLYDCLPFSGQAIHPISNKMINFANRHSFTYRTKLYQDLATSENVAFRKGQLKFRQWTMKNKEIKRVIQNNIPLTQWKLIPDFKQKGVDIKIGLDIAWLSSKNIVDNIVLFTGDTDFVPAMKYARSEGVRVIMASFKSSIPSALKEHADGLRIIDPFSCGITP